MRNGFSSQNNRTNIISNKTFGTNPVRPPDANRVGENQQQKLILWIQ